MSEKRCNCGNVMTNCESTCKECANSGTLVIEDEICASCSTPAVGRCESCNAPICPDHESGKYSDVYECKNESACSKRIENAASQITSPVEPKAQVESVVFEKREVGGWFPKAQEKSASVEKSQYADGYAQGRKDEALDAKNYGPVEPKVGGSGGLPELDTTEEEKREARETYENGAKYASYESMFETLFSVGLCRERQLQASLLREKGLVELLRECSMYITGRSNRSCKLRERIKAAVTGE